MSCVRREDLNDVVRVKVSFTFDIMYDKQPYSQLLTTEHAFERHELKIFELLLVDMIRDKHPYTCAIRMSGKPASPLLDCETPALSIDPLVAKYIIVYSASTCKKTLKKKHWVVPTGREEKTEDLLM